MYKRFDLSCLGAEALGQAFAVIMKGPMVPAKDYRTVILTARLLRHGGSALRFVLMGGGEDRAQPVAEPADLVAEGIV